MAGEDDHVLDELEHEGGQQLDLAVLAQPEGS